MRWFTPLQMMTVATTLFVGPLVASAQIRPVTPTADISRMRGDLDRLNAQIADLKRAGRGIRDDYRLRGLMADSEALARRLTDAESRLRGPTGPAPTAVAVESVGVLEAKADILEDQSNRLTTQADSFVRAASQVKTRQLLRQRAGQFDRDPFAGLDASKRSMIVGAPNARPDATKGRESTFATDEPSGTRSSLSPPAQPPAAASDTARATAPAAAPSNPGVAGGAPPALAAPPAQAAAPSGTPESIQAVPTAGPPISTALPPAAPAPVLPTFSPQTRTVIDPATAADLRRFDAGGPAPTDPAALERMATALRLRAQALAGQARDLRTRARAR